METAAPLLIYKRNDSQAIEPLWGRLLALGIAMICLAVLLTAAHLPPSPSGVATHRGLGLAECGLLARTGIPCFSCGMTTSFSWFVRGNLLASFYVQPMGCLLALLTCCTVWIGSYIAITGRPVYRLLGLVAGRYVLIPMLTFGIMAWGWKVLIHLSGHDGW
ncbi:MAG TPA: DUF2752 domain-containing protein [Humisphaera sp.]|jgi:hypothetical protein|nr:DUF2752 domain-containing protein [Humisphaera sp.]